MFPNLSTIFTVLALLFVSWTVAFPSSIHLRRALSARAPEPLDTIPAYIKRAGPPNYRKRGVNTIPAEDATQSLDGTIELYTKRAVNTIPAEIATQSLDGTIQPYTKRAVNTIPAEIATQSLDGTIQPYTKRAVNTIPAEIATQSLDGTIQPYP